MLLKKRTEKYKARLKAVMVRLKSSKDRFLSVALVASTILIVIFTAPSIFGLLSTTLTLTKVISIVGNVTTVNVEAYWDRGCTDRVTAIDWGIIQPGSSKNETIYLKNEADTPVTLSLDTRSWSPSAASKHISLTWDYSGQQVKAAKAIKVTMTLTVSPDISGTTNFNFFDVVITGTPQTT